jgi:hypothetical protein
LLDNAQISVGLLPDVMWNMTWDEYGRACQAQEMREIREWQRTRQLGEWNAAFAGVDLRKELGNKRLLELPTDQPNLPRIGGKIETEEEFFARMAASGLIPAKKKK